MSGERIEDFIRHGVEAQKAADRVLLLHRARVCLNRWAARYAKSDHAKAHVAETRDLIEGINRWIDDLG
jgi:hypothetical protein